jgi:NADH-quinone oxidoreductase subunit J
VLLNADFLAVTQLLIYVGGILILLVFGVMLTSKVIDVRMRAGALQTIPAVILVAGLAGVLCGVFYVSDWKRAPLPELKSTAPKLGEMLMTTYLLPFEVASVVLLVALVGAAMIARKEKSSQK